MSANKEPGFFCRPQDGPCPSGRVATREEYEALFDSEALVRGDCTPAYSQHPRRAGVPEGFGDLVQRPGFFTSSAIPLSPSVAQVQHDYSTGQRP